MPTYTFECDGCGHVWEIVCSIKEYTDKQTCPECRKRKTVHRKYDVDCVYGAYSYSLNEVKTVGHYADKQTEKMSSDERDSILASQKTQKSGGMKELPTGMSRMTDAQSMPTPNTKADAIKRRKNK